MKWIIIDKQTGNKSRPVGLEWFLFGDKDGFNYDLEFDADQSTLPLSDFKFFINEFEIKEVPDEPPIKEEESQDELLAEVIAFFFKSSDPLTWRDQFKSKFHITRKQ